MVFPVATNSEPPIAATPPIDQIPPPWPVRYEAAGKEPLVSNPITQPA